MQSMHQQQRRIDLKDDLFSAMDGNADREITKEELIDFFQSMGQVPEEGLFESEDLNGDGVIAWEEFSGPKGETGKQTQGNAGAAAAGAAQGQQQQQQVGFLDGWTD